MFQRWIIKIRKTLLLIVSFKDLTDIILIDVDVGFSVDRVGKAGQLDDFAQLRAENY